MRVKFYGTRGSFPVSDKNVIKYGGSTSCIMIETSSGQHIIIDSGTGIRAYGNELLADGNNKEVFIFYTHFHMDHVQGLPFFMPAYDKNFTIHLASLQEDKGPDKLKMMIEGMMNPQFCPVTFDMLHADFHIHDMEVMKNLLNGVWIETIALNHPGGCGGIKVTDHEGKSVAVMVDNELEDDIKSFSAFCKGVDLLVHDAQYTDDEYKTTKGWGHSTFSRTVAMAQEAQVGRLVMTHHDPDHFDDFLSKVEQTCQQSFPNSTLAKEGLVLVI